MRDPSSFQATVQCAGCSKSMVVPAGPVRAAAQKGQPFVTFCSLKCNRLYVAKEGRKAQDEQLRIRRRDAGVAEQR